MPARETRREIDRLRRPAAGTLGTSSIASAAHRGQLSPMSTLAEIESAATALSPREKAELLLFVASQLRAEGAPLPEPRLFSPDQLQAWMDEDEDDMRKFRAGA